MHGEPKDDQVSQNEEVSKYPELYEMIMMKDSLLFQVGFNQIDTGQVSRLISEDFEFYHDVHGVMDSKENFIASINGLSDLSFKTWRELRDGTVEIFPLYTDNKTQLYGIIQTGKHEFYQQEEGEKAKRTSIAIFNHLWIKEDGDWKLKRVLSYDHLNTE